MGQRVIFSGTLKHPDGGTSYPFWSQNIYLKKMATVPAKQSEVLEICLAIETNNARVRNDLLEIALLLPAEMAVQIVDSIDEIDYFLSPQNYGKLIKYLAAKGKTAEAASLARRVLVLNLTRDQLPKLTGIKCHTTPFP